MRSRTDIPIPLGLLAILACAAFGGAQDPRASEKPGDLVPGFGRAGVVVSNPSSLDDWARAVVIDSGTIYVVGTSFAPGPSDSQWWIEKRSALDGSLDPGFGTGGDLMINPSRGRDSAFQIALDASSLYIVGDDESPGSGQWRIEKRSRKDGSRINGFGKAGVVTTDPSSSKHDGATGVAIDGAFLYIIGEDGSGESVQWRMEKRRLTDGALDPGFGVKGVLQSDPSARDDWPTDLAVDSRSLYVLGVAGLGTAADTGWRIEKRSLEDGSLDPGFGEGGAVTSNPSTHAEGTHEPAGGIALDSDSFYVAGDDLSLGPSDWQWRIEKRSVEDGSLDPGFGKGGVVTTNPGPGPDHVWEIAFDEGFLYVIGQEAGEGKIDRDWRVERRRASDGGPDAGFGAGGAVTSDPGPLWDMPRSLAIDASAIYVVGQDHSHGKHDRGRRIEKRRK